VSTTAIESFQLRGDFDASAIVAATSEIVYQCRAVESGFLSSPNTEALERDVDVLLAAADEFDLDAPFDRPQASVQPETTLRDQIEEAIRRNNDREVTMYRRKFWDVFHFDRHVLCLGQRRVPINVCKKNRLPDVKSVEN